MKSTYKIPDKGDPSDILQFFPKADLKLLCCRYWWLQHWEFSELSFPYWRIYHNTLEGASIMFNNKIYKLDPDKIVMIAPNTSYATRLYNYKIPEYGYKLVGERIGKKQTEEQMLKEAVIPHLFIHFNLGMPYDNSYPGIYIFDLNEGIDQKLNKIKKHLKEGSAQFNFFTVLSIQSVIHDLLSELPESNWNLISNDYRILNTIDFIENNLNKQLTNNTLAEKTRLATNAFTRLFTQEIGISPQRYVKKKRIDQACILLHHFNFSIEKVAQETGFADRYHFSRIFKEITGISPANYRKAFVMK